MKMRFDTDAPRRGPAWAAGKAVGPSEVREPFFAMPAPVKHDLQVFSTCPPSVFGTPLQYGRQIRDIARLSEDVGCDGILVYTGNAQIDPWLAAQFIIEATRRLCPLVSVEPLYMHPYTVAKMISSLAFLYGRQVHLNIVAAGRTPDLAALGAAAAPAERCAVLVEYVRIVEQLLRDGRATHEGRHYRLAGATMVPKFPENLMPRVLISASSDAGRRAAQALGAIPVEFPKPPGAYAPYAGACDASGAIRIGIIARANEDEAWNAARARFPSNGKRHLAAPAARSCTPAARILPAAVQPQTSAADSVYWPLPLHNARTLCPYLVGSHDGVARALARYAGAGYRTLILDGPAATEDMRHIGAALGRTGDYRPA